MPGLVARIAWLMRVARCLDIPILATAEDMNRNARLVLEHAFLLVSSASATVA